MILHIFTISTGIYNNYLNFQLQSLDNIYPGINKTYNLISDKFVDLDISKYQNLISYKYYHIANLPYPFIPLFKTQYICDMIKLEEYSDDDIFLYCDADSFFLKMSNNFYQNIFNDNKIYFTYSPWLLNNKYDITYQEMCELNNPKSITYVNTNKNEFKIIQSSLFFGNIGLLKKINNKIMNYLAYDGENRIIPRMPDQSLLNKFLYDNKDNLNIEINFFTINYYKQLDINTIYKTLDNFKCCGESFYYKDFKDTIFCIQKMNEHIKDSKRWSKKFSEFI